MVFTAICLRYFRLPYSALDRKYEIQIPTRIPEKVVVALFSGILVISGIVVVAGRQLTNYQVSQARFCALRDFLLVSEMLDN